MSLFMKLFSLCNPIQFSAILYPTSLANLVVEVEARHSHTILFINLKIARNVPFG